MHLKSIKAFGFKSFADKTELEIKKGITAVVGPNGSGKSNIVDAVKWVLGEQSVKSLRGNNNMSDVIFSGSASRNAQNRAMVSLTFDNTDHYLNSDFQEIEIKRVVYRTGENEYYINNAKVRLKDITELFMDSGAGKESFNIISQGAVADIINSKPEDRRSIFEEAAGVLKYKKRKEESVKKLERTKENLEKVELLIAELETTLAPLKEQSDKAKQFLEYKENLEKIEIALITSDITAINEDYQKIKRELETLESEVAKLTTTNTEEISKIEKLKLSQIKIDDDINKLNNEALALTKEIAETETQKQIILERQKLTIDHDTISLNLVELKENALSITNQITNIQSAITALEEEKESTKESLNSAKEGYQKTALELQTLEQNISITHQEHQQTLNTIVILKDNIESNSRLPYAVKNILNNPRLSGIHNIIANLITMKDEYTTAIETALGANSSVIVVDNESSAKKAITYLKENRLGRATFFPLNIIKGKSIDASTLAEIKQDPDFIAIASQLVTYDPVYEEIIANQLGNILIVKDIDALNRIGKLINYRYRIVSLDGEIQYSGGAISGGAQKNTNSTIKDKQTLETLHQKEVQETEKLNNLKQRSSELNLSLTTTRVTIDTLITAEVSISEKLNQKTLEMANLNQKLKEIQQSIANNESHLENKIDENLNKLIESLYQKSSEKDTLLSQIERLRSHKSDLATEIAELENINRQKNSAYNKKQTALKDCEIKLSKMDVKLDNLLLTLNENYNMTYEHAKEHYELDLEIETARLQVASLKSNINKLGVVNLGAQEEYQRINTRYEFLTTQKQELDTSVTDLLALITEMDEIMVSKFKETFAEIQKEFSIIFKQLFKGGKGILKLTDEEDLLNTGIDIIAEPPGKKLNSIVLLSGGEKTLTAIAVLFSILSIKTVPFCILDEVEAALDEANVDAFGKYLETKKDKSQFIIITHKKKTMEYADVLYGITMQESGVSKLVSVKLENN